MFKHWKRTAYFIVLYLNQFINWTKSKKTRIYFQSIKKRMKKRENNLKRKSFLDNYIQQLQMFMNKLKQILISPLQTMKSLSHCSWKQRELKLFWKVFLAQYRWLLWPRSWKNKRITSLKKNKYTLILLRRFWISSLRKKKLRKMLNLGIKLIHNRNLNMKTWLCSFALSNWCMVHSLLLTSKRKSWTKLLNISIKFCRKAKRI